MKEHTLIKGCWNTLGKLVKEPHSNHAVNTHFSQQTRILLAKRLLEIQVVNHQSNDFITKSERTIFWHSFELKFMFMLNAVRLCWKEELTDMSSAIAEMLRLGASVGRQRRKHTSSPCQKP